MFPTATCKVEGLLLVRLISIALFSPRPPDHVVRQSSACSVQSEMSGGGQGSAKIRQGGGIDGGAIRATWLAGELLMLQEETRDSTNTFLSCCLLFEANASSSSIVWLHKARSTWSYSYVGLDACIGCQPANSWSIIQVVTKSAGPREQPAAWSRFSSADTWNENIGKYQDA